MGKTRIEMCTPIVIVDKLHPSRATAGVTPVAQADLMFMRSLYVSTGENKNDDVFLPDEMWKARFSPVYKPVNWEHNSGKELSPEEQLKNQGKVVVDNQTIGVMYNTYAVDDEHKVIKENDAVPSKFHIMDEAIIWKSLYPATAKRIEKGCEEKTLFVSMETWFTDYDYLVGNKVVARNEETAFLDEVLRANGGVGKFGESRVKRVLRNLTFGGKGIVSRPANEPSVITSVTHEPMCASASVNKIIQKNVLFDITKASTPGKDFVMSLDNQQVANTVSLEQYTKAHDELATLRAEAKSSEEKISSAEKEVVELKSKLDGLAQAFVEGAKQLEENLSGFASRVTSGNPENFFSVLAEELEKNKVAKAELESKLSKALEEINKIKEEARLATREAQIDALLAKSNMTDEVRKEKKDKLSASMRNLGDDEFSSLLEAFAELSITSAEYMKEDEAKKDKDKDKKFKKSKDEKKDKSKELAALLQVDESAARDILSTLNGSEKQEEEEDLESVLASVKASEKTPPAGEDAQQGIDLTKAYGSLVETMLNAHKPQSE